MVTNFKKYLFTFASIAFLFSISNTQAAVPVTGIFDIQIGKPLPFKECKADQGKKKINKLDKPCFAAYNPNEQLNVNSQVTIIFPATGGFKILREIDDFYSVMFVKLIDGKVDFAEFGTNYAENVRDFETLKKLWGNPKFQAQDTVMTMGGNSKQAVKAFWEIGGDSGPAYSFVNSTVILKSKTSKAFSY